MALAAACGAAPMLAAGWSGVGGGRAASAAAFRIRLRLTATHRSLCTPSSIRHPSGVTSTTAAAGKRSFSGPAGNGSSRSGAGGGDAAARPGPPARRLPQQQQQPRRSDMHAVADVVVVGAGAAGLTAAFFAAKAGAKVLCLERTREAGKKILMSGGTRCNVLPLSVDLDVDFFTESSRSALRAVFATWSVEQAHAWLQDDVGLQLQLEEETAKWFPATNSARDVRDGLVAACRRAGVEFRYDSSLEGVEQCTADEDDGGGSSSGGSGRGEGTSEPSASSSAGAAGEGEREEQGEGATGKRGGGKKSQQQQQQQQQRRDWLCLLREGGSVRGRVVVLATGGLSFPAVGTDGTGHRIIRQLGHSLSPPYAALTPLLGRHPGTEQLAGLSLTSVRLSAFKQNAAAASSKPVPLGPKDQSGSGSSTRGSSGGGGGPAVAAAVAVATGGAAVASGSSSKGVVSVPLQAAVRAKKPIYTAQRGGFLFTHKGYSGPAVLDLSHQAVMCLERGEVPPVICASWTGDSPAEWDARLRAGGTALVSTVLQRGGVRERLAAALCGTLGLTGRTVGQLRKEERAALVEALTAYPLNVTGHEGYKKAEVTGGGVPLNQIDCRTGESRVLPGLFLCGELVDVFGRIGGFNFYFAWVTGRLAGRGAAAAAASRAAGTDA